MKKIAFLILIGLLIFSPISVFSADMSINLEWQSNTEKDLAGYRAYMRQDGTGYDYSKPVYEGTETACKITGLDDTKTYYFVLRAFDVEGYESKNSNEVFIVSGNVPDGLPPGATKIISVTKVVTTSP